MRFEITKVTEADFVVLLFQYFVVKQNNSNIQITSDVSCQLKKI